MHLPSSSLPGLALLAGTLALGQGCWIFMNEGGGDFEWDTAGEDPCESSHRFYDGSDYPGDGAFSGHRDVGAYPLAVGSQLIVIQAYIDTDTDGFDVQVDDESVLSVEVDGGPRARLAALAAGTTDVTYDVWGSSDDPRCPLEVREVHEVAYLVAWDLGEQTGIAPDEATVGGYALRPGAVVQVAADPRDEEGQRLSGQGLFTWSWDAEMLTVSQEQATVSTVEIEALGTGIVELDPGLGTPMELHLLEEDQETELLLFEPNPSELQELNSIEGESDDMAFGLAAFDEEGRYVVPGPDEELLVSVAEGPESLLADYRDYLEDYNGIGLTLCPGEGELLIEYAGGSLLVPVSLEDGQETPQACD